MQKDQILQAPLLDIIFDNRNKAYGAYQLRLQYPSTLKKAITLTIIPAVLLALLALLYKPLRVIEYVIPMENPAFAPPPKFPEKEIVRATTARAAAGHHNAHSSRLEFTEDTATETNPGLTDHGPGTDSIFEPVVPAVPSLLPATPPEPAVDRNLPVASADVMPGYPGGMEALHKFLQKNLQEPSGLQEGETRSVSIRFVVGYDGLLRGFQTIQDGGEIYNNEVIRVLKKMPAWIPGKSKGEEVSVYFVLPVKFTAAE